MLSLLRSALAIGLLASAINASPTELLQRNGAKSSLVCKECYLVFKEGVRASENQAWCFTNEAKASSKPKDCGKFKVEKQGTGLSISWDTNFIQTNSDGYIVSTSDPGAIPNSHLDENSWLNIDDHTYFTTDGDQLKFATSVANLAAGAKEDLYQIWITKTLDLPDRKSGFVHDINLPVLRWVEDVATNANKGDS
ncbi:MAG: hypothetical protein M1829_002255 [Trizodia sp. TS-e1964]|nr:MAG: hypothetical protein M1829_002255 [Trizodia sp. TS-e1964]